MTTDPSPPSTHLLEYHMLMVGEVEMMKVGRRAS